MNKDMPKIEITCSKNKKWFNKNVLEAIKRRDIRYKKYKLSSQQKDWEDYKNSKNAVVSIIRNEKQTFLKQGIAQATFLVIAP